jgi:hypothetical protein
MKTKELFFSILVAIVLTTSPAFAQQVIEWDDMRATANGSGCSKWDTAFIAAGNQITAIFSTLGVDLSGTWDDRIAEKKTCTIVVPATIKKGWYIGSLKQTIFYGYTRTGGTRGMVSLQGRFFNYYIGGIKKWIPTPGQDPYYAPYVEAAAPEQYFGILDPSFCSSPDDYEGNYLAILTVLGQRKDTNEDIVVQIDGEDIKFEAMGTPSLCEEEVEIDIPITL